MKNIIFTRWILLILVTPIIFSACSKRTVAFKDPGKIEWHSPSVNSEATSPSPESIQASNEKDITPVLSETTKIDLSKPVAPKAENKDISEIFEKAEKNPEKLSRAEKKELRRELKKEFKNTFKDTQTEMNTLLLVIIAILLPPLAVGLVRGWTSGAFWLNILLTLLFYVPGLIHALVVVFSR